MVRIAVSVRKYTYEELETRLNPADRIVILSCQSCAELNDGLGGETGAAVLAEKLTKNGFRVTSRQLLASACAPDQLKESIRDDEMRSLFSEADVIIPLACRAGIERVEENLPQLNILTVTETLGFGTYSPETGVHLTEPAENIKIVIDDETGITLKEAAARLGLYHGGF